MGEWAIARVIGILTCAGLIWVGIGFGAFALTTVLAPELGLAGAAAVTAAFLLIGPAFVVIFYGRRRSTRLREDASETVLSAIASIARERPLLAVLGAALFGAVEVFLKAPRKK
jgi:sulfite exporter TauE/SafE